MADHATKAAMEQLRKELRARTGGKLAGPPAAPPPGDHVAPPDEGSPEEEAPESPAEEGKEGGDEMVTCPKCGTTFDAAANEPKGEEGAPPEHGGGHADLLMLMPKGKGG